MADELLAQRYRVIRELGAGGMGRILLAEDTSLSIQSEPHLVAVKENTNVSHDAQEQFRREARILARLAHPNLPKVTHHFVEPTGKQYLVMDYIRGDDVQQLLRKGPLTEQESLACMAQILDALSYLHNWQDPDTGRRQPVIHRDIKPSNIKRTQQGQYMLVDFGIAKLSGLTETQPSARAYTSGYAPLEQYDGGTDERSDIYSLGATLYSMLTARTPPTATNRVSGVAVPQPRHYNASLSNHVGRVIDRAMQVKPKDRFQSAAAMYLELFGRSLPDRSVRSDADLSPVPTGPVWQRPVAAILLAVAGFVLVALALILFLQRKDSQVNAPLPTATAQLVQPATTAATTTLASAIVVAKETLVATRLPAVAPSASNVIAVVETPVATGRNNTSPPPTAPAATSTPLPATVYPQQVTVSTAYLDMLRDNAQRLVVRPDQPPIQKQGLIRGAQAGMYAFSGSGAPDQRLVVQSYRTGSYTLRLLGADGIQLARVAPGAEIRQALPGAQDYYLVVESGGGGLPIPYHFSIALLVLGTPTPTPTDVPDVQFEVPDDITGEMPTESPIGEATDFPIEEPTDTATGDPTDVATDEPTAMPIDEATDTPTEAPSNSVPEIPSEPPIDTPAAGTGVQP